MSSLTFKEKLLISEVLECDNGYVFTVLQKFVKYNKTTTRNIILGACGIDIFENSNYSNLSQQQCLEQIWETESDAIAGQVLLDFLQYFFEHYPQRFLNEQRKKQYNKCLEVAKRLKKNSDVKLPLSNIETLKILNRDIAESFAQGNPELCLDRLHTFTTEYLREICIKHGIATSNNKGQNYPLHNLSGSLQKFYRESGLVESEFSLAALRNSIDLFTKYNDIRNDQSFAHPNKVLNKAEAAYVVQIMASTLTLIEQIEALIDKKEGRSWIHDVIPPTM